MPPFPGRRPLRSARALVTAFAVTLGVTAAEAGDVVVFAAASLKNALDTVAAEYESEAGTAVRISYAGSNTLASQIEKGAPADIFFSADVAWMDDLDRKGLLKPGTRTSLLGNRLVLIAPRDAEPSLTIAPGFRLAEALGDGLLAMANVDSVPAGRYGKAALIALGVWDAVAKRVAQADSVRGALAFVARRETPLGIVYATDAAAEPAVKVVGTFPPDTHPPIVYPVALLAGATDPEAARFFAYLIGPRAKEVFAQHGFIGLGPSG